MKTFFNLIQEVQKPGLCHHCGGCVTFCTAINDGALETGEGEGVFRKSSSPPSPYFSPTPPGETPPLSRRPLRL
jgi:hypothetical protein